MILYRKLNQPKKVMSSYRGEANCSKYTIHPGMNKMYKDMRRMYWWKGKKNNVKDFIVKCLICQLMKFKHQRLGGKLLPLDILMYKWDDIVCDFIVELSRLKKNHDVIWVVIDRLTKCVIFMPV